MDPAIASLITSILGVVLTLGLNYLTFKRTESTNQLEGIKVTAKAKADEQTASVQLETAESVANSAVASAAATLSTASTNIVSVQNDTIQTLRAAITEVQTRATAQNASQQTQIDLLKSDDARLRVELARAILEAAEAKREATDARGEITRLRLRNSELEAKVAELTSQLASKQDKEVP